MNSQTKQASSINSSAHFLLHHMHISRTVWLPA